MPASRNAELDARVLEVLRERGPQTPSAIGRVLGLGRLGVRGVLGRLQYRGLARVAGTADTPRGWGMEVPEFIWEAVPQESE